MFREKDERYKQAKDKTSGRACTYIQGTLYIYIYIYMRMYDLREKIKLNRKQKRARERKRV